MTFFKTPVLVGKIRLLRNAIKIASAMHAPDSPLITEMLPVILRNLDLYEDGMVVAVEAEITPRSYSLNIRRPDPGTSFGPLDRITNLRD